MSIYITDRLGQADGSRNAGGDVPRRLIAEVLAMSRVIPGTWSPADGAALAQVQAALDRWLITTPAAEQPLSGAARRQALEPLYARERDAFAGENAHFNRMRRELGALAVWSLFGSGDLRTPHPFGAMSWLLYRAHWGPGAVVQALPGDTWLDLYRAAEACIGASGDRHPLFIEQLTPVADRVATLELHTGR